jgi:Cu(I)/Ag(I) efflux system membrane fusion protein
VEIIAGLKEGDEVVTSAQFLFDSEASLAGSIQRLDANRTAEKRGKEHRTVFGNGIVEAVDAKSRRIRISHGPIQALGWAPMTMEFDVLPGADLEQINIGQSIHFSLGQSEVGDYIIKVIHQPEPAGIDEDVKDESDHNHQPKGTS